MLSANFKPKRTAAASRGFLATARLSCTNVLQAIRPLRPEWTGMLMTVDWYSYHFLIINSKYVIFMTKNYYLANIFQSRNTGIRTPTIPGFGIKKSGRDLGIAISNSWASICSALLITVGLNHSCLIVTVKAVTVRTMCGTAGLVVFAMHDVTRQNSMLS